MGGLPEADEGLEVAADELGAAVGDDARLRLGVRFAGLLQDDLGVGLLHLRAEVPGDDGAGAAVEHRQR